MATVPPPAARRDETGFEIVEWSDGQPHFEGEIIAAYVTLDASGRKLHMMHGRSQKHRSHHLNPTQPASAQATSRAAGESARQTATKEPEEATESFPLWRDLILATWGADPLQCPCCKGTMKRVETLIQPEKIEKRRRLVGALDRNPRGG